VNTFSFVPLEESIARAAREGVTEAAEQFAERLRAQGEQASVQTAPDGTAQVLLEGAATVAREFGTRTVPARPVIGAALQAERPGIVAAVAQNITDALKGTRS